MKARSTSRRNFRRRLRRRYRKAVRKSQMTRLLKNPEIKKQAALVERMAAHFFAEGMMSMFDIFTLMLSRCPENCIDCISSNFLIDELRPNYPRFRAGNEPIYKLSRRIRIETNIGDYYGPLGPQFRGFT